MIDKITIPAVMDCHVHLRQGDMLQSVAPHTGAYCGAIIVMPNTTPPLTTAARLTAYLEDARKYLQNTKVYGVAKLTQHTTPEDVREVHKAGGLGFKLYPEGVTTNSDDGISHDLLIHPTPQLASVYAEIERLGLVLLNHAEMPGHFCMDREIGFHRVIQQMLYNYPKMRYTVEHVTDLSTIKLIQSLAASGKRIAGTITAHHLICTLDDVVGDGLRPDNYCKPIAKEPQDRDALIRAATSGSPYFFLGSDSAPHDTVHKYCAVGCAGVFTAPVLLPVLCKVFEEAGRIDMLPTFTTWAAQKFYDVERSHPYHAPSRPTVTVVRMPWTVPDKYQADVGLSDGQRAYRMAAGTARFVVPFMAGRTLDWQVVE